MTLLGDIVAFRLTDELRLLRRRKMAVPLGPDQRAALERQVARLNLNVHEKKLLSDLLLRHHDSPATRGVREELKQVMRALLGLMQDPKLCQDLLSEKVRDWQATRQPMLQLTHALTVTAYVLPAIHVPRAAPYPPGDPLFAVMLALGIVIDFVHGIVRRKK